MQMYNVVESYVRKMMSPPLMDVIFLMKHEIISISSKADQGGYAETFEEKKGIK